MAGDTPRREVDLPSVRRAVADIALAFDRAKIDEETASRLLGSGGGSRGALLPAGVHWREAESLMGTRYWLLEDDEGQIVAKLTHVGGLRPSWTSAVWNDAKRRLE